LHRGLDRLDAFVPHSNGLTARSLEALIGRNGAALAALARSYEFTERLSTFVEPFSRNARGDKETPSPWAAR
jgi:hypothetical protein